MPNTDGTLSHGEKWRRKNAIQSFADLTAHRDHAVRIDSGVCSSMGSNEQYEAGLWCQTCEEPVGAWCRSWRRTVL